MKNKPRKKTNSRRTARRPQQSSGPASSSRGPTLAIGIAIGLALAGGLWLTRGSAPEPKKADATPVKRAAPKSALIEASNPQPPAGDPPPLTAFGQPIDGPRRIEKPEDSELPEAPELKEPAPQEAVSAAPRGDTRSGRVKRVIDGDTFHMTDGTKVRLVGINTPEKGTPLCPEATEALRRMVADREVTLAFDVERTDQYGRTLAYVYVGDLFVNAEQARLGLAYFYEWKPNTRHSDLIRKLQREAREAGRGLWGLAVKGEDHYLTTRHHFHRPGCKRARKRSQKLTDRNEALDRGLNPCRECAP